MFITVFGRFRSFAQYIATTCAVVAWHTELVREVLEHARVASGGGGTGAACTVVGFDFDAAFDEVRATRFRPCCLLSLASVFVCALELLV